MAFSINTQSCTGCALCYQDCVCGIISMQNNRPYIADTNMALCVHCGHCAAICPTGALLLDGQKQHLLPSRGKSSLSSGQMDFLFKGRRSIRQYSSKEVHTDILTKALEYASFAPTAHNARQVAYTVVNGRKKVEELSQRTAAHMKIYGMYPKHVHNVENGKDTLFRNAPCLILVHAPERVLSESDCATAISYLELSLHSMGLGSCWAGMLIESCVYGMPAGISIPKGHKLYGALMAGYPLFPYNAIPIRSLPNIQWI
ncbi:MAG: nitroreductase family protein [Mailhella sp.]